MTRFSIRSVLALGAAAAVLLWSGAARAQITPPEDTYTYKPCLTVKLKPGEMVKVPTRCAKRDGQTRIILRLKGGVAGATLKVSGLGVFRFSGRLKHLRVAVGTSVTLMRESNLGGPGGVFLTVMDYSKPIPVGTVWDNDNTPLNPNQPLP